MRHVEQDMDFWLQRQHEIEQKIGYISMQLTQAESEAEFVNRQLERLINRKAFLTGQPLPLELPGQRLPVEERRLTLVWNADTMT